MLSKQNLRILIVAEIVLAVAAGVVSYATWSLLPEPLLMYLREEVRGPMTPKQVVQFGIGSLYVLVFLVASIGLFLCWRPARILYLFTAIISVLLTPFFGPHVDAGWGQMLTEASQVLSGGIIALVYFSQLKELYENQ
jgi:hypothetical protein